MDSSTVASRSIEMHPSSCVSFIAKLIAGMWQKRRRTQKSKIFSSKRVTLHREISIRREQQLYSYFIQHQRGRMRTRIISILNVISGS